VKFIECSSETSRSNQFAAKNNSVTEGKVLFNFNNLLFFEKKDPIFIKRKNRFCEFKL
jgi:hypothetical protein